jgi:hypothetical protein
MRSMHRRPSGVPVVLCLALCLALCFGSNLVTASFASPPITCTAQTTAYAYENIACDHPFAGEDYPSYDCWRVIFASVDGSAHADITIENDTMTVHVIGEITSDKSNFSNHIDEIWGDLGDGYSFILDSTGFYLSDPYNTYTFSASVSNAPSDYILEGTGSISAPSFNYQNVTAVIHIAGSACYPPRGGCMGIGDGSGGYGLGQQSWGGTYEACP